MKSLSKVMSAFLFFCIFSAVSSAFAGVAKPVNTEQVKIFSIRVDINNRDGVSSLGALENEINVWLKTNPKIRIFKREVSIVQAGGEPSAYTPGASSYRISTSAVVVTIFYIQE